MKKVISVLMVAVALMMAAPAQAQLIKFGLKGGMNFTKLDFDAKSVKHDMGAEWKWWLASDRWWKVMPPIIVGFHGAAIDFSDDPTQMLYEESTGSAVEPLSLYEAQLRERLGYVPLWLQMLK